MGQTNYTVGDFLIAVKNAALARKKNVKVRDTKAINSIAKVLLKLGFVSDIKKEDDFLDIYLAYKNKVAVLTDVKLVSRPGLRVCWDLKRIANYRSPFILILSTPKGILSSKDALRQGVGGEVIAKVL